MITEEKAELWPPSSYEGPSAAVWVSVDLLKPWDKNPRKNDPAVPAVARSIKRFGFVAPIVVWKGGDRMVAGHTRLKAFRSILEREPGFVPTGAPGVGMVPVRFHEFASEAEADAYALADNRLNEIAEWDHDELSEILKGMDTETVSVIGFDDYKPIELDGETYTKKITAPIYEPKGERPKVKDLFDDEKTKKLIEEIEASDLPEEVQKFLSIAADRHTVFNFRNIAEYYAHADAKTQALMEKSALVIIDFEKAIENGFVRMTGRLGELVETEGWSGDAPE